MTFLESLARRLYARYGNEISSLRMVLPSRRAQLFFSEALTGIIDKPIWEPIFTSIEKIAEEFTPLRKAEDFSLLVDLYSIYLKHTQSKESFDRFYFWGETLLRDFNDVDNHLVDAEILFRNLKEQKELEGDFSFLTPEQIEYIRLFWSSFDAGKNGELQNRFIEIWDALPAIYSDFRNVLRKKGEAYSGMIYRDAAEKIQTTGAENLPGQYVFAGFNALSKCEHILLAELRDAGKAEFYWDYNPYYLENKKQEAGFFMRDNLKNFPANENPKHPNLDEPSDSNLRNMFDSLDLHLISVPSDVLQSKILPTVLKEMNAACNRNTAVILADANLLIPTLYSLPDDYEEINVTLGYPLKHTPIFALTELLIRLQNSYKLGSHTGFYHKDLLAVLKHRYVEAIAGNEASKIAAFIVQNNIVYVPKKLFESNSFLQKIFTPLNDYKEIIDYLTEILATIANMPDSETNRNTALLREYVFHTTKALNKLKTSIAEHNLDIGKPVFASLICDLFRSLKIPFTGEPVRGLQIMELKETRALDFENLVILSANEGRLPAESDHPSFVPYNLRRAYEMPYIERNEAISAYYFYRLMQGASKVRLLYSSKTDQNRTGEMSRYLYQLKFESGIDIKEYHVTYDVNLKEKSEIKIPKDEAIMQQLARYADPLSDASLSPSSLSAYIACPLKFYFNKILRIKIPETLSEELPANLLGNIVHKVMEQLYKPMINRQIVSEEIQNLLKNGKLLDELADKALAEEFYKTEKLPENFDENGNMLIAQYVIGRYIRGILKYDAKNPHFVPKNLEGKVRAAYKINTDGNLRTLNIEGIIDRLDMIEIDGKPALRVVDYKTGAGRGKDKRMRFAGVESLFSENPAERNSEVFQAFLYCAILHEIEPETEIIPALYFVRDCYSPQFTCKIFDAVNKSTVNNFGCYAKEFREQLDDCISEIFDPNIPFIQTEYQENCTYCPFAKICEKEA
ncbi:MAG: PD-(D/E)XK nuclease family protein [Prevotellaceae bacterium]|jgi:CRISPR/Cas system-associated exonuclease Cas4 (RecB family)|nr:PD-(D/E)XK nuclease family protein [Prevotellaceae bacterium]